MRGGPPYTLSESPDAAENDYTASDWSCEVQESDQRVTAQVENGVLEGNVVKVPSNTTVVCTIVNIRDPAELKLVKKVEGKAKADDWTLSAKAEKPDDDLDFSNKGGSGQFETVYAGTEYTLAESGPGGYSPSDWVCAVVPKDEQVDPQESRRSI